MACAEFAPPGLVKENDSVQSRPNIILIVADDVGWSDLGSYGSGFYQTPNLDALAASGVRFTHAYAAAATCSPTRASILTGQYPLRTGFLLPSGHTEGERKHHLRDLSRPYIRAVGPASVNYLADNYYTLGEALKDKGYRTAFLGKWHLGFAPHTPANNGFDLVVGGGHYPSPPGKDHNRAYYAPWKGDNFPESSQHLDMHIDDYLAQRASEFISTNRDEPFFLCFWPYSVHSPFQSKPELIEKWEGRVDPANPQHNPIMAAMIEVLDTSVGRVLDAVNENKLDQNTIIIFTSDNGGNMYNQVYETTATNNAPLRSGKGSNYDGGVRVPLIVRWPGVTHAGTISAAAITSPDHYPTILEITGLAALPKDHKDGKSYTPALRGKPFERGVILSENTQNAPQIGDAANTSIRDNNWKLIRYWYSQDPQTHSYELFDISSDIGETNNLAAAYPEIAQALVAALDAYYDLNGILRPMPNRRYDGRSVGLWTSEGPGTARSDNGVLVLESRETGFSATTYFIPLVLRTALFEFEARAKGTQSLWVDWLSGDDHHSTNGPELALTPQWQQYSVQLEHESILQALRLAPAGSHYKVEIRAARILSPDHTEMMRYEFNQDR